jgi:hypothetical protein
MMRLVVKKIGIFPVKKVMLEGSVRSFKGKEHES